MSGGKICYRARGAVSGSAMYLLSYILSCVWRGQLLLSNVGCFGWHHLLPCNVSSIGLCLTALFVTVHYGLFSGGVIYYCVV